MTTFGLYGARLSLAVWRHFTCYIFFVFTYNFVLSLKNKYTKNTKNYIVNIQCELNYIVDMSLTVL